jgi:hypothetical protein
MISCDKLPPIFYKTVAKELTQVICDTLYNPGAGATENDDVVDAPVAAETSTSAGPELYNTVDQVYPQPDAKSIKLPYETANIVGGTGFQSGGGEGGAKRDPRREILTLVDNFVKRALSDVTQKQITDSFAISFTDVVSQNMQVFFSDQYISMYMMKTLLDEERAGTNSHGETFKKMLQIITSSGVNLYEPKSGDDIQSKKTESIMGQLSIIPVKKDETSKNHTNMSGGVEVTDVMKALAAATSGFAGSSSLQTQSDKASKLGKTVVDSVDAVTRAATGAASYLLGRKSNEKNTTSVPNTSIPASQSTASKITSPAIVPTTSNETIPTSVPTTSTKGIGPITASKYSTLGSIGASKLVDKGQGLFTSAIKTVFGPVVQKISGEIVEMIEKDLSLKEYVPQQISEDIYNLVKEALQFHLAKPEGRQMFLRQIEPLLKRYVFTYTSSSSDLLTLSVLRHLSTSEPMKSLLENTIKKHIDLYNDGQPNDYIETVYKNIYSAINERLIENNPIMTMYETMQSMFTSGQIGKKIIYDYDDNESLYKTPFYTSKNDILSRLKITEETPTIVGDAITPPLVEHKDIQSVNPVSIIETDSNNATNAKPQFELDEELLKNTWETYNEVTDLGTLKDAAFTSFISEKKLEGYYITGMLKLKALYEASTTFDAYKNVMQKIIDEENKKPQFGLNGELNEELLKNTWKTYNEVTDLAKLKEAASISKNKLEGYYIIGIWQLKAQYRELTTFNAYKNVMQKIIDEENAKLTKKTGGKSKRVSKTKRRRRTFRKRNMTQRHL